MIMRKLLYTLPAIALILGVSACREEIEPGPVPGPVDGNMVIKFSVGNGGDPDTKTSASGKAKQTDKILITDQNDANQLFLVETVQSLDGAYTAKTGVDTKGVPVYTENFVQIHSAINGIPYEYAAGTMGMRGPIDGSKQMSCIDQEKRTYAYDFEAKDWPEGKNLLFFLNAPANMTAAGVSGLTYTQDTKDPNNGITSFHYVSPSSDEMSVTEIPSEIEGGDPTILEELKTAVDATKLKDILFTSKGINKNDYWKNSDENSKVLFYHALAGVKFKSDNARKEDHTGNKVTTTILSVTLTNIISEGDCVVTPDQSYNASDSNANPGSVRKSSAASKWSNKDFDNLKNYTLANKGIVGRGSATYNFDESFYGSETAQYGEYNINSANYEDTFFFVPQKNGECGKDVNVVITYTLSTDKDKSGNPIVHTRAIKLSSFNWEAGNLYTYTLSANHVDITVHDQLDADQKVKSDLSITNTGNTDCYIRAAIIANWFDIHNDVKNQSQETALLGDHQIVANWSGFKVVDGKLTVVNEEEGTFEGIDTQNWIYSDPANGGDGFFYYKYKVKPGNQTRFPLFESFKVGTCPHSVYKDSGHLEMDILVQNFDASKLEKMKAGKWWSKGDATFDPRYDDEL